MNGTDRRPGKWAFLAFAWSVAMSSAGLVADSVFAERPFVAPAPDRSIGTSAVHNEAYPEPMALAPIKPGMLVDPHGLPVGTHLVLRYRLKLSSGDVAKLRKSIRDTIESFTTLALIEVEPDPTQVGRFRRAAHRLGIGVPGDAGDRVVTKDSATELDFGLGPIELKILGGREEDLNRVRSPGASPTMAMFDFPLLFLRDSKPVPIVIRYLALVDPADGTVETVYWVLDETAEGYRFSGDSLWLLKPDHELNWDLDVNGDKITFGVPRADAFVSTRLPPGTARTVTAKFQAAATARSFTVDSGAALEQQTRESLFGRDSSR